MPEKGDKTIGQIFVELTQELRTLFRQELELFSAEMKEKVINIVKDTAGIGIGGVLIHSGVLVLLAAAVLGLATVMPAWGAALLVAIACIGTGAALALNRARDLTHMEIKPEQTAETLKETVQWAKTLKLRSSTPRRTRFANRSGIRKAI